MSVPCPSYVPSVLPTGSVYGDFIGFLHGSPFLVDLEWFLGRQNLDLIVDSVTCERPYTLIFNRTILFLWSPYYLVSIIFLCVNLERVFTLTRARLRNSLNSFKNTRVSVNDTDTSELNPKAKVAQESDNFSESAKSPASSLDTGPHGLSSLCELQKRSVNRQSESNSPRSTKSKTSGHTKLDPADSSDIISDHDHVTSDLDPPIDSQEPIHTHIVQHSDGSQLPSSDGETYLKSIIY